MMKGFGRFGAGPGRSSGRKKKKKR